MADISDKAVKEAIEKVDLIGLLKSAMKQAFELGRESVLAELDDQIEAIQKIKEKSNT